MFVNRFRSMGSALGLAASTTRSQAPAVARGGGASTRTKAITKSPPAGTASSFTQRVSPFYHPVDPKKRFSTAAGAIIAAGRACSFASLKTPVGGSEGGAEEDPEVRTHAMRTKTCAPRHAH